MPNLINQIMLDQYRIDAYVAFGGMGAVYRVWDLKRNVPPALKVLQSEPADDPHMFQSFQSKANILKWLTHSNIGQFYGLFHILDMAFMLERFIDDSSLKDIFRQKKQLSLQEGLVYLKVLCSVLDCAHTYGVMHFDVKPGNVLIDWEFDEKVY